MKRIFEWLFCVFGAALIIPLLLHFLWLIGIIITWGDLEYPFKNLMIGNVIRALVIIGLILGTIIYYLINEERSEKTRKAK